jgi:hypothetical protein
MCDAQSEQFRGCAIFLQRRGTDPERNDCKKIVKKEDLINWDKRLQERAKDPKDGDDLDEYIQDTLAVSDSMSW